MIAPVCKKKKQKWHEGEISEGACCGLCAVHKLDVRSDRQRIGWKAKETIRLFNVSSSLRSSRSAVDATGVFPSVLWVMLYASFYIARLTSVRRLAKLRRSAKVVSRWKLRTELKRSLLNQLPMKNPHEWRAYSLARILFHSNYFSLEIRAREDTPKTKKSRDTTNAIASFTWHTNSLRSE